MKAYYGFKVKGKAAEYLEQFKDFQWTTTQNTGFLGVEINSTEYVAKVINFPKMLENYLIVNYLREIKDKALINKLISYQKEEEKPIIFIPQERTSKYFKSWTEYEIYKKSKNQI